MLLDSPRFMPGDREHWRRMEALDARWCLTLAFARKVDRALRALDAFHATHDGAGYCGVSWGKDSCVVAHLCAGRWPLVWVRVLGIENPECSAVQAEFARQTGFASVTIDVHLDVDSDGVAHATGTLERGFAEAVARFGRPHVSGIRSDESSSRRMRHARWGENSPHTCAPLSAWTGEDVFAYLHLHQLPVHPAYAMTLGGRLDRNRIRVASIGGKRGTGVGRAEWEQTYYSDVLAGQ